MKVAILQWVDEGRSSHGTIERISTSGKDMVDFFKMQMEALGFKSFKASEESQLALLDEERYCQFPDSVIRDYDGLQKFIQLRLDEGVLIVLHLLALNREEEESKWFKIQIRNVH